MYHQTIEQFLKAANEYLDPEQRIFSVILKTFCEQYPTINADDLRNYNSFLTLQMVNSQIHYRHDNEQSDIYEVHIVFAHWIKIGDQHCDDTLFKVLPVERFIAESTVLSELREVTSGIARPIYLGEHAGFSRDGMVLFHPFKTYYLLDKANIESTELLVHRDSLIRNYYGTISQSS